METKEKPTQRCDNMLTTKDGKLIKEWNDPITFTELVRRDRITTSYVLGVNHIFEPYKSLSICGKKSISDRHLIKEDRPNKIPNLCWACKDWIEDRLRM